MNNKEKFLVLDSLRGIGACIIAFFWHYHHFAPQLYPLASVFQVFYDYGWYMVEVFFMISGFVMAYSYKDKIVTRTISFWTYISRRIKHIYPLMLITLFVITIEECIHIKLTGRVFAYGDFDAIHFLLNLFCVQCGWFCSEFSFNVPAWCISVELFLYLVFYFLIFLFKKKIKLIFFIYGFMVALGIIVYEMKWNYPILNFPMARGIISFFIGCILYEVFSFAYKRRTWIAYALMLEVLILLVITKIKGYGFWTDMELGFTLLMAPAILWIVLSVKWIRMILEWKPFVWWGNCSLSVYLWHYPTQCLLAIINVLLKNKFNYSSIIFFLIYILSVISISIISKIGIENQLNVWWKMRELKKENLA